MAHLVPRIEYPELVIGLVAPIGTALTETISQLRHRFESARYDVVEIKVTDIYRFLTPHVTPEVKLDDSDQVRRYRSYIAYGNQVRSELNDGAVLAALTIQRIVSSRIKADKRDSEKFSKTVYILNQFKRPEEIDLLRAVYGKIFFQISVYSRRAARVDYLSRLFAEDAG